MRNSIEELVSRVWSLLNVYPCGQQIILVPNKASPDTFHVVSQSVLVCVSNLKVRSYVKQNTEWLYILCNRAAHQTIQCDYHA